MLYDNKSLDREIKLIAVSLFAMIGISSMSSARIVIRQQCPLRDQSAILMDCRICMFAKRRTLNKFGRPYGPQFTDIIYLN